MYRGFIRGNFYAVYYKGSLEEVNQKNAYVIMGGFTDLAYMIRACHDGYLQAAELGDQ